MSSSEQVSSDTSAPSTLIVSDDAGNLDGSWLSANYPTLAPLKQINLARAQSLGTVLSYSLAGSTIPRWRNAQDLIVPSLSDMAGLPLPRFPADVQGRVHGLLIEPGSTNLLAYDRLGFSSGVYLAGCALSGAVRRSVDGQSPLMGLMNQTPQGEHGVVFTPPAKTQGPMSASFAVMSPTLSVFVVRYARTDGTLASAVVNTQTLSVSSLTGQTVGWVEQDTLGWYWVSLGLGSFAALEGGTFSVWATNSTVGNTVYAGSTDSWWIDALQLENTLIPTSPMLASAAATVSRGTETVVTPAPVTNLDNWLDTNTGQSTTILECHLPRYTPPSGTVVELLRWSANAQQYLVLGYTSNLQLGLYLTDESENLSVVSAVSLTPGSVFKVAVAQAANQLTGFAVNGKTSLSYGTLASVALPVGVTSALQLASGELALTVVKLAGYDQALSPAQLKYLTSV